MVEVDRIWEFLQRLSPMTRSCLLAELERLELCGVDMPGSADIQAKLRVEFRKDGSTHGRAGDPARLFFAPMEPLLVDAEPDHENFGRISRGSLSPIWEWISRDLLPTMSRDYIEAINKLITADKHKEAQRTATAFQIKVLKYLDNTLGVPDAAKQTRAKLAAYTSSRSAYGDLTKMMAVLRAREALGKFNELLPAKIDKFDDGRVAKMTPLLDAFRKDHAAALPFALALVSKRLKIQWQLIRLATKGAASKNAADIAAMPYAIAVSMVLDRLDDQRLALRVALKKNRVLVAREILAAIYDTEFALQVRIDKLDESGWGKRLHHLMHLIAVLVEEEVSRFPEEVGHVLGSRTLHGNRSFAARLTFLAWKGRDAVTSGAAFCMKLVSPAQKSRA
jgi:hypothetical protein